MIMYSFLLCYCLFYFYFSKYLSTINIEDSMDRTRIDIPMDFVFCLFLILFSGGETVHSNHRITPLR